MPTGRACSRFSTASATCAARRCCSASSSSTRTRWSSGCRARSSRRSPSSFGGGAGVLGLLYAAPFAGALVASLRSGWMSDVRRQGLAVCIAAAAWGVGDRALRLRRGALARPDLPRGRRRGGQHQRGAPLEHPLDCDAGLDARPPLRDRAGAGRGRAGDRQRRGRHRRLADERARLDRLGRRAHAWSAPPSCALASRPSSATTRDIHRTNEARPRLLRPQRPRGRAGARRRDAARRRRRGPDRRGRGLRPRGSRRRTASAAAPRATPRCSARRATRTSTARTASTGA